MTNITYSLRIIDFICRYIKSEDIKVEARLTKGINKMLGEKKKM